MLSCSPGQVILIGCNTQQKRRSESLPLPPTKLGKCHSKLIETVSWREWGVTSKFRPKPNSPLEIVNLKKRHGKT